MSGALTDESSRLLELLLLSWLVLCREGGNHVEKRLICLYNVAKDSG
jgi:hypothetical protein